MRDWGDLSSPHEQHGVALAVDDSINQEQRFLRSRQDLRAQLISKLDLSAIGRIGEDELRAEVRRATEELCRFGWDFLTSSEQERLVNEVLDEIFGYGPLEPLMRDSTISDILINGPKSVYVERNGRLEHAKIAFDDDKHLLQIVQRIVAGAGCRVDEACPTVDARLPDGSRISAVVPPLTLDGPLVSIRRFGRRPLLAGDLLAKQTLTKPMFEFLSACVEARVNIVIAGGAGSGKTTLLNALSVFIPNGERVITIEDAAELRLQQPHVARMEARSPNVEGAHEKTTRDLIRSAMRMRPDRLIVGACRGPEALDMLQAMSAGHGGSMTTIHGNDTRDALGRLEMMAGLDTPPWVTRRHIASAIHLVVQITRLAGGARKVVSISEITGVEDDVISMHELFGYRQTGVDRERKAEGYFYVTGIRPNCLKRLANYGVDLPVEMFERRANEW